MLNRYIMKDTVHSVVSVGVESLWEDLQRCISTPGRKMGSWEECVTQNSTKPTRCLTRHFSVGMLKRDHHIDQQGSCASGLSQLWRKIPPMTSLLISRQCWADRGPASNSLSTPPYFITDIFWPSEWAEFEMKEGEGRLSLSLCNSSSTITFSSSSKGDRNQEHLHTAGSKPLNNNATKHGGKKKASLELKQECLPELHFSSHCPLSKCTRSAQLRLFFSQNAELGTLQSHKEFLIVSVQRTWSFFSLADSLNSVHRIFLCSHVVVVTHSKLQMTLCGACLLQHGL